jgi:hypothetical protein
MLIIRAWLPKGRLLVRMVKGYVLPKSTSDRKKTDTVVRQAIETKTEKEAPL